MWENLLALYKLLTPIIAALVFIHALLPITSLSHQLVIHVNLMVPHLSYGFFDEQIISRALNTQETPDIILTHSYKGKIILF